MNLWIFPVADNGKYIGSINVDCRYGDKNSYFGGATYVNTFSSLLEKGSFCIFQPALGESVYAIYENDEIVNIIGDTYNGPDITFDEISSFGYVIDSDYINNIVYTYDDMDNQISELFD